MAAPSPLTLLSALVPVVSWYVEHGSLPRWRDCIAANHLPHWAYLYKHLPPAAGFSGRLSAGLAEVGLCLGNPLGVPGQKYLPCLGPDCNVSFWTTRETRLCPDCRGHARRRTDCTVDDAETLALRRVDLRRLGLRPDNWAEEVMTW